MIEVCTSMLLVDNDGVEYDEDVILMVEVVDYTAVKGSYSYNAPSDVDYYGYEEIDFNVKEVWVDNGKFDKRVPFDPEQFNNPADIERIEDAIREDREDV